MRKTSDEIRTERHRTPPAPGLLTVACLWPKKGENLGTLARTCDAVGATIVVPATANTTKALLKGNTIGLHNTVKFQPDDPMEWLAAAPDYYDIILGVELARHAIPLKDLTEAETPTLVVLGHEVDGIPDEAFKYLDDIVEIPMFGVGNSLNVAVAGSLVLYKLAGLV